MVLLTPEGLLLQPLSSSLSELRDFFVFLIDIVDRKKWNLVAYFEDVGFHVKGNNAQASATFAGHCRAIEMGLLLSGIRTIKVRPQKWEKGFLKTVPRDKRIRKKKTKDTVARRLPAIRITDWNADALGILFYAIEAGGYQDAEFDFSYAGTFEGSSPLLS